MQSRPGIIPLRLAPGLLLASGMESDISTLPISDVLGSIDLSFCWQAVRGPAPQNRRNVLFP